MATRSNIIVKFGGTTLYLYRHWDGYPAINGAFLYESLKHALMGNPHRADVPSRFLNHLFGAREETRKADDSAAYEFTNGIHGDIEWLYEISFTREGAFVRMVERTGDWKKPFDETILKGLPMTVEQFRAAINKEITAMNRRVAELAKENPGTTYATIEPMALLA
jgi:hypothetical protein